MATEDLKEKFADILISYQRGEIDLPEALAAVRDMTDDDEIEEPEFDDDETETELEADGGDESNTSGVDQEALDAAAADLDAALATVNNRL